jgi:dihydroorotase
LKILIQAARILSPGSPFHQKKKNLLISNGKITSIGDKSPAADKIVDASGMFLSAGWFDLGTFVGDPGLEQKEDIRSLIAAAAAGGFTGVAVLPNTSPPLQSKNEVTYLIQGNPSRLVQIHALAAVTRGCKGEDLTEMIDLHEAGALAFTDGLVPLWHTDVFLKALQYLQKFNGLLIDHPEDIWLNKYGQMNEGINSTVLGLKGMPRIAEEVTISRNIELLSYAGGRLHMSKLSTAKSIDLMRTAKKKGLAVTCDVTSYQPLFGDNMLSSFDTNYKVNPPLREKSDQDSIIKGLKDGTIDIITSGHSPQDDESKFVEFDVADFGMTNLQTFASQLVMLNKQLEWEELIPKITDNPRKLLGLEIPKIEEDAEANLTLFNPAEEWVLNDKSNFSKSKNSPWYGQQITGKVKGVIRQESSWFDE